MSNVRVIVDDDSGVQLFIDGKYVEGLSYLKGHSGVVLRVDHPSWEVNPFTKDLFIKSSYIVVEPVQTSLGLISGLYIVESKEDITSNLIGVVGGFLVQEVKYYD